MQTIKIEAYNHGKLVGEFCCYESQLDVYMERIRGVMPSSARLIAFEPCNVRALAVVVNGKQVY